MHFKLAGFHKYSLCILTYVSVAQLESCIKIFAFLRSDRGSHSEKKNSLELHRRSSRHNLFHIQSWAFSAIVKTTSRQERQLLQASLSRKCVTYEIKITQILDILSFLLYLCEGLLLSAAFYRAHNHLVNLMVTSKTH